MVCFILDLKRKFLLSKFLIKKMELLIVLMIPMKVPRCVIIPQISLQPVDQQ